MHQYSFERKHHGEITDLYRKIEAELFNQDLERNEVIYIRNSPVRHFEMSYPLLIEEATQFKENI